MLHYAGPKVQNIFYTLPELEKEEEKQSGPYAAGYVFPKDEYDTAVEKLNQFFEPKQNALYEQHVFRQLKQKKNERFDMFVMRLREQADRCDFKDQLGDNLRAQIASGCRSVVLQRKILEKPKADLSKIIQMGQIMEVVSKQQEAFGKDAPQGGMMPANEMNDENVCKIETKRNFGNRARFGSSSFDGICGRCGLKGHKSADEKCPARGKTCNSCGRKDHFARKCFIRGNGNSDGRGLKRKAGVEAEARPNKMKKEEVQLVETEMAQSITDEYEDIFCIDAADVKNKIGCVIGGVDAEMIVDSGSRYNIVDRTSWLELKAKNVETTRRQKEVVFIWNNVQFE